MLSSVRSLTALLNLLLALALLALAVPGTTSEKTYPDELFGSFWCLAFAFMAGKAAILLFRPRFLAEGLHWHKRVAALWFLSAGVNIVLSSASVIPRGGGCGTGAFVWPDVVLFGAMALLWGVLGRVCEVLFKQQAR